ncbi:MAG: hypothetical protein RBG13Loki_2173 [Promethearchaeota archaeon CR_4]|nr:MAG: hypothetical protein RBG13Loki_2173 [Candidatus Lokiarchaeota archaeon CR_4]
MKESSEKSNKVKLPHVIHQMMNLVIELVVSDPEILGGKPVIKGTRMPVSLTFELAGD